MYITDVISSNSFLIETWSSKVDVITIELLYLLFYLDYLHGFTTF